MVLARPRVVKFLISTDNCVNKIQKKIGEVKSEQGEGHSIFGVPESLRNLVPDAFLPHLVSIGPYHRNKDRLKEMENHKRRILQHVLNRTRLPLESLVNAMLDLEEYTRNRYEKPFPDISKEEFVEMMLLDACFMLELFCVSAYGYKKYKHTSDPSGRFNLRGFMPFIQRDLLMLENQLPLSVLHKMFTLAWQKSTPNESIGNLVVKFFNPLIPGISKNLHLPKQPRNEPIPPYLHLLDVVHQALIPSKLIIKQESSSSSEGTQTDRVSTPPNPEQDYETGHLICSHGHCFIPCTTIPLPHFCTIFCAARTSAQARNGEGKRESSSSSSSSGPPEIVMHSVTRLRGTGINFVPNKDSTTFMDIEYKEGKLLIPSLRIDGSTKSTFLNLMAFEQCYPYCKRYITSYISFMDGLVDSSKDAEHLIEKQIISHELGSEEDVATLFNNLRREIFMNARDSYLFDESKKLNDQYQQKWRSWYPTLKHEYLKDPWKIISLVAAGLLILLTIAQTVYTIIGYHIPNKS